ncbi:exodeoxyribonuclease VII small subunit [Coprococcus sp. AM14-16]|jgi:exodeoxyribonuclease VII small subunit|uniref:exodeoxyribonuclease VII small subunit n=1 Tax=Coprococcus TaxID=33042 RepID=UPI000E40C20C|nr:MULTISPECIES: exodeoxyribonuclease VII small subunit [Coprococcus]RGD40766.1 exodeoxyribonuclease VII small subunit [Coprococcus sp. AM14-16]RGG98941.1 exodeoxyribonuclease VII small subunit [Coprococcus sp. AF16-22]RHR66968.1 exodeoxyribonuclease VII small subunit [Coprococcus sp. AF16-5]
MAEDTQNMDTADTLQDVSIEEALARLDEIAAALENTDTGLKKSMELYSEGVQLINRCRNYLCDVEKEMITLSGQEEA